MTRRCGLALHRAGVPLLIVNRSLAPAAELAASVAGRAVSLEQFRENPEAIAALVLAAGGGEPVLDGRVLRLLTQAKADVPLAIDFGVPPNVDPEEARSAGMIRIGMSDLVQEVQERRLTELLRLAPVRAAIDERLTRLRDEMAARAIGPQLAQLRDSFERIAADELERALAQELRGLAAEQRAAVNDLASRLAHRLAHLPIAGLRAAAAHAGPEVMEAFFKEARLHRELRTMRPADATPAPAGEDPLP
jgi:glutamyl-tRNA reductase